MIARLNVTRFSNEDVIATSGAPVIEPEFCENYGTSHYYIGRTGDDNKAYFYSEVEGLTPVPAWDGLSVPGNATPGSYYYHDGTNWILCENQAHH